MPELDDATLDFLLNRAGLSPTEAQKAGLKSVYPIIAAMAANVRKPRGRMAEPGLVFRYAEEDL